MRFSIIRGFFVLFSVLVSTTASGGLVDTAPQVVDLEFDGSDFAYDAARSLVYVSIPTRNELAVVSTVSGEVVDRVFIGARPLGITLSKDGNSVFAALNQAAAVGVYDTRTGSVSEIVVGDGLGNSLANDVAEPSPGRLFVSASPSSGGFARIAQVDLGGDGAVTTVASNRIIRANPTFLESPAGDVLYVGEAFSPNSLYALDLTQETAPIILEDDHGTVSGTTGQTSISPDGSRIFLNGGQVLRADSFLQAGRTGPGLPAVSPDGQTVYAAESGVLIQAYSTQTFLESGSVELPSTLDGSSFSFATKFGVFDIAGEQDGFILLRGSELVIAVPEPTTAFAFAIGLAGCVSCRRRAGVLV